MDLTDDISQHYRQQSSEQLLKLYNQEIGSLTPAAREMLIAEIKKRNIDAGMWQDSLHYHSYDFVIEEEQVKKILLFFESGWTPSTIKAYLMMQGMPEDTAALSIERIPDYLKKRTAAAISMITNGVLFFVMGAAARALPLSADRHKGVILLCYIFMTFGIIRLFHGWYTKRRTKKLLEKWISSPDDIDGSAIPSGEETDGIERI